MENEHSKKMSLTDTYIGGIFAIVAAFGAVFLLIWLTPETSECRIRIKDAMHHMKVVNARIEIPALDIDTESDTDGTIYFKTTEDKKQLVVIKVTKIGYKNFRDTCSIQSLNLKIIKLELDRDLNMDLLIH